MPREKTPPNRLLLNSLRTAGATLSLASFFMASGTTKVWAYCTITTTSATCDSTTSPSTYPYAIGTGLASTITSVFVADGQTVYPTLPSSNYSAISLGNNVNITINGIVQNNAASGGNYGTGPNTIEFKNNGLLTIGATGQVLSLGSAANGEAINVQGANNTIINYGLIQSVPNPGAKFAIYQETAGALTIDNYGQIKTGPLGATSGRESVIGGATNSGITFTNRSGALVVGRIAFGAGQDTLILYTGSSITGGANGGATSTNDKLYLKGDGAQSLTDIVNFNYLYKQDAGTWTLADNISFNNTEIQQGILSVTGQLTSPVSISATGTLQGTGTVIGDISNGGTIAPGLSNAGGSLAVTGNVTNSGTVSGYDYTSNLNITGTYTQSSGANFVTHINGLSAGSYSKITSTNALNIASGSIITADLNPKLKLNAGDVIPGVITGSGTPTQSGAITVNTLSDRYKLASRYAGANGQNVDLYLPDSGILNAYGAPGTYYGALQQQTLSSVAAIQVPTLGVLHQRYAVLNAVSEYDCNKFDKYNFCISAMARATGFGSQATGAGVFNIAYRPTNQLHIGAYIDYQAAAGNPSYVNGAPIAATLSPGSVRYGYDNPTFGGYAGFSQSGYSGNLVNTGLQIFVSGAYNPGKVTVTRALIMNPDLPFVDSQPGSGDASLNSSIIRGMLGYGIPLTDKATLMPYAGLRFTDVTRGGYMEAFNAIVTQPLAYNSYYERLFTGFGGAMLNGRITDNFGTLIGLGLETDLTRYANSFSGYSPNAIQDLTIFGFEHGGSWNGLRPTANAGAYYDIAGNQRISLNGFAGQQAWTSRTYATGLLGYQMSF